MPANPHFMDFPVFPAPEFTMAPELYKGKNEQNILVVLSADEDTEVLQTFLGKILSAVQLDLEKDALLLAAPPDEPPHLGAIVRQKSIQTAIIFGLRPDRLGVHAAVSRYQPAVLGSLRLLFVHPLTEIYEERQSGGKEKAGALWKALKSLFSPG